MYFKIFTVLCKIHLNTFDKKYSEFFYDYHPVKTWCRYAPTLHSWWNATASSHLHLNIQGVPSYNLHTKMSQMFILLSSILSYTSFICLYFQKKMRKTGCMCSPPDLLSLSKEKVKTCTWNPGLKNRPALQQPVRPGIFKCIQIFWIAVTISEIVWIKDGWKFYTFAPASVW